MRLRPLPAPLALACAGTAAAFGLLLAVRHGAVPLTRAEFLAALSGSGSGPDRFIITGLRAPRALMAGLVGGGLAVAGVTFAGVIGFVGLIVPHGVRLVAGGDHRLLLPLSFLTGAAFLTVADLVARTALAPAEIPVGIVTALVGVPFFLLLLKKGSGR